MSNIGTSLTVGFIHVSYLVSVDSLLSIHVVPPLVSSNFSCLFVLFLLAIVLHVLLQLTASGNLFGILKYFTLIILVMIAITEDGHVDL
jgi:hypothetical protein